MAKRLERQIAATLPLEAIDNIGHIPLGFTPATAAAHTGFLFVSGCPRSGTSALGRLLNIHADVAIFTELYSDPFGYTPAMFDPSTIGRLHAMDILSPLRSHGNADILAGLGAARWVGDKRPNFMRAGVLTLSRFRLDRVVVVHIVRDAYHVAYSYLQRAEVGSWNRRRDHRFAVDELNMNARNVLELSRTPMAEKHKLVVVNYETFWSDPQNFSTLLKAIGADPDRFDTDAVALMFRNADIITARTRGLSDEQIAYIDEHLDHPAYEALLALASV